MEKNNCQGQSHSLLVSLADVPETEAEWLVDKYIPKGQIAILAGDGGSGKTTLWCSIAAAVSSGKRLFFEPDSADRQAEPQKVLFFSSEDSLECILKARLRKSGANLDNIYSVNMSNENFSRIKFNSPLLKELIEEIKPTLVVFDPMQSFIPPDIQMSQRNAMRHCLNPLIGLGEKYGVTFLIVLHTNKRQGVYGRNRIADSADVWDIARSVLIAGSTKERGIRYLSHEKSNYSDLGRTILFSINDGVAVFEEYSDKQDADFVRERDISMFHSPQRKNAKDFILDYLRDGEKPTAQLNEESKLVGISEKTLERAKTELRKEGVLCTKSKGYGQDKVFFSFLSDAVEENDGQSAEPS